MAPDSGNVKPGGLPPVTAESLDALREALELWRQCAFVVGSATIQQMPSMHKIVLEVVWIDPNLPGAVYPTSYNPPLDAPKWGLGYTTLQRLEQAAGITWDTARSRRVDDGSDPDVCEYEAVGRVRDLSGMYRTVADSYRLDMKVREQEAYLEAQKYWKADATHTAATRDADCRESARAKMLAIRKHALSRTISGAKSRVIAALLGLPRGGWKASELAKRPFVLAKLVPDIDYAHDPMARAMLVASHTGLAEMAYASGQPLFSIAPPVSQPAPALPPAPPAPRMIEAPRDPEPVPLQDEPEPAEHPEPVPPPDDDMAEAGDNAPPDELFPGPQVEDFDSAGREQRIAMVRALADRLPPDRRPRKPLESMTDDGLRKWYESLK